MSDEARAVKPSWITRKGLTTGVMNMEAKGKTKKKSAPAKTNMKDMQVSKGKAGKVQGGKASYGPETLSSR